LGRYCFISAGAVVARDVPDYALIAGVPGRQKGWMSRHAHMLRPDSEGWCQCPESGFRYQLERDEDGQERMRCLDLDEEAPLPEELTVGRLSYDELKNRFRQLPATGSCTIEP